MTEDDIMCLEDYGEPCVFCGLEDNSCDCILPKHFPKCNVFEKLKRLFIISNKGT